MASVYRRKHSPYWYAEIRTPCGERIRRSTHCRDKTQAARLAREWERRLEQEAADAAAGLRKASNITLIDLIALFLHAYTLLKKAASYIVTMEGHFKVRILEYFGANTRAADITEQQVREFRRALLAGTAPRNSAPGQRRPNGPMGVGTVNKHVMTLRLLFRFGVEEGHLVHNPAERIKSIKKKSDPRHRALNDREIKALEAELREEYVQWTRWIGDTGMRAKEAAELEWPDINVDRLEVTVRASTAKDADNRVVPLTDAALAVLDALEPDPKKRRGKVFGKKQRRYQLVQAWKRTGLPGRAPSTHDFRHTFASKAVADGVNLEELRLMMGHESVVTTQGYIHKYGDVVGEARKKLNEGAKKRARDLGALMPSGEPSQAQTAPMVNVHVYLGGEAESRAGDRRVMREVIDVLEQRDQVEGQKAAASESRGNGRAGERRAPGGEQEYGQDEDQGQGDQDQDKDQVQVQVQDQVRESVSEGLVQVPTLPPGKARGYCFAPANSPRAQPGASKALLPSSTPDDAGTAEHNGPQIPVSHIRPHTSILSDRLMPTLPSYVTQLLGMIESTGGRNRTGTRLPPLDFESSASTNSATPARNS